MEDCHLGEPLVRHEWSSKEVFEGTDKGCEKLQGCPVRNSGARRGKGMRGWVLRGGCCELLFGNGAGKYALNGEPCVADGM